MNFEIILGLKIDRNKSFLCDINYEASKLERCASIVGCEISSTPSNYLGLPLGTVLIACPLELGGGKDTSMSTLTENGSLL